MMLSPDWHLDPKGRMEKEWRYKQLETWNLEIWVPRREWSQRSSAIDGISLNEYSCMVFSNLVLGLECREPCGLYMVVRFPMYLDARGCYRIQVPWALYERHSLHSMYIKCRQAVLWWFPRVAVVYMILWSQCVNLHSHLKSNYYFSTTQHSKYQRRSRRTATTASMA